MKKIILTIFCLVSLDALSAVVTVEGYIGKYRTFSIDTHLDGAKIQGMGWVILVDEDGNELTVGNCPASSHGKTIFINDNDNLVNSAILSAKMSEARVDVVVDDAKFVYNGGCRIEGVSIL